VTSFDFYGASVGGFGDGGIWLDADTGEDQLVRIAQDRHEPLAFATGHGEALLWIDPSGRDESVSSATTSSWRVPFSS
jgi:hypothetical protein